MEYAINYDYIVKVLCENKEKPEVACNGKCHLKKELANASDSETPASQNDKKGFSPIELYCNIEIEIPVSMTFCMLPAQAIFCPVTSDTVGFDGTVFHPPIRA